MAEKMCESSRTLGLTTMRDPRLTPFAAGLRPLESPKQDLLHSETDASSLIALRGTESQTQSFRMLRALAPSVSLAWSAGSQLCGCCIEYPASANVKYRERQNHHWSVPLDNAATARGHKR